MKDRIKKLFYILTSIYKNGLTDADKDFWKNENESLKSEVKKLKNGIKNLKKCSSEAELEYNFGDDGDMYAYRIMTHHDIDENNITDYQLIRDIMNAKDNKYSEKWEEVNALKKQIDELQSIKERYIHLRASVKALSNGELRKGRN